VIGVSVPVPASVAAPDITPMKEKKRQDGINCGDLSFFRSYLIASFLALSVKGELVHSTPRVIEKMTADATESQTSSEYYASEKRQIPKRYYSPQPQEKSEKYNGKLESVIKVAFSDVESVVHTCLSCYII
jgi:hypothetical protein